MAHGGDPPPGPFPLPVRGEAPARRDAQRRGPGRYCYLFDVDEELAGDLDQAAVAAARLDE